MRQQLGDLFKIISGEIAASLVHSLGTTTTRPARSAPGVFHGIGATLAMAWHIPEVTSPDVPALDLLSTILGDGRSSRLYRRVRRQRPVGRQPLHPGDGSVPRRRRAAAALRRPRRRGGHRGHLSTAARACQPAPASSLNEPGSGAHASTCPRGRVGRPTL